MRAIILLGALGVLGVHTSVAAAGVPTWCKPGDEKPSYDVKSLYTETDVYRALSELVGASCYPESDVANQEKQIAARRNAWSKKLNLTEADWADVAEWAQLPRHLQGDPNFDVRDRKAAWSAYSPLDQFGVLMRSDMGDIDGAYIADAFGDKLTAVGRLAYFSSCVDLEKDAANVKYAMCAADAAALDATKVAAEVRADTSHGVADRMAVRFVAYEVFTTKLAKYQADVKEMRAKDPAYDTMFKLAEQAAAEWSKADARWVKLAADLDDARATGSRKASAGCETKSFEAWGAALTAVGSKRLSDIRSSPENQYGKQLTGEVINNPNGYLAALTVASCAVLEDKEDFLSEAIGFSLAKWPGYRGPRSGTQTAILTAGLTLDDRSASIEYPEVKRHWMKGDMNIGNYGAGVVASVNVEGDKATVQFKKEKVTQQRCVRGHETNKIRTIYADGHVTYWYQCDEEITETIEVEPFRPMKVRARYVAGLKPGMRVEITDDVVVAAWGKKGAVALVTGIEVK